jgi:hypothetical protein
VPSVINLLTLKQKIIGTSGVHNTGLRSVRKHEKRPFADKVSVSICMGGDVWPVQLLGVMRVQCLRATGLRSNCASGTPSLMSCPSHLSPCNHCMAVVP